MYGWNGVITVAAHERRNRVAASSDLRKNLASGSRLPEELVMRKCANTNDVGGILNEAVRGGREDGDTDSAFDGEKRGDGSNAN